MVDSVLVDSPGWDVIAYEEFFSPYRFYVVWSGVGSVGGLAEKVAHIYKNLWKAYAP